MEIGPKIVVFDPAVDEEWAKALAEIHVKEALLHEACLPSEFIDGETDDGEPIWVKAEEELGPERDVEEKVAQFSSYLPDLTKAYQECGGPESKFSFRISADAHNFFGDAASIDQYFLREISLNFASKTFQTYSTKAIVLLYNGVYYGHAWYFTHANYPEFCGIYGMKSSLVNLLHRLACPIGEGHRKGIAKRILVDGVYPLMKSEGRKKIIVPWPLPPMIPILNSMGYLEHNENGQTPERLFLNSLTMTSNYFTFDF